MRRATRPATSPAAPAILAAVLAAILLAVPSATAGAARSGSAPTNPLTLTEVEGLTALVQTTRQGVLVLVPASGIRLDPVADAADSYFLSVEDPSVRVIFCPATLLDPAGSDPAVACLDAAAARDTVMLSGSGRLRASGLADRSGLPGCPASVQVGASVRSPGGDLLDLSGALVLAPSSDGRECRVVQEELHLAYEGPGADSAASVEPVEPSGTSLAPVGGSAALEAMGSRGVSDVLNTILSRLSDLRNRLSAIRSTLGDNRPDLKGLVQSIEVPKLRQLIEEVRGSLDGLLGTAQELRQGYETFAPGGSCSAGPACLAFREDLKRVLDDLERGFETVQRLHCFERPQLEIRSFDTSLMRRLLLEKAPPLVLYAGSRFLDRIPEWSTRLGNVIDEIPVELTQFCEEPGASPLRVMARQDRCERILAVPEERFSRIKSVLGFSKTGMELVIPWIDEKKSITIGAVAVGGATIGTDVKVPVKPVLEDVKALIEGIGVMVEARANFHSSCARERQALQQEGAARELELRQCSPGVATFLEGVQASADLVQQRIDAMRTEGFTTREAQRMHDQALQEPDARDGYRLLCDAYTELVRPSGKRPGSATITQQGRMQTRPRR